MGGEGLRPDRRAGEQVSRRAWNLAIFLIGEKNYKKGLVEQEYGGTIWAVWLLRFRNKKRR